MTKYLVPKKRFNHDLGVRTFWEVLDYKVEDIKQEGVVINIPTFLSNEFIKEHFNIVEK